MFFACCLISKPLESRVRKHWSWTNGFSFCVCGERGMHLKEMLSRARKWCVACAGSTCLLWKKNCRLLGRQLVGFPVGCALAVSPDGLKPSDLLPNFPCLEDLSWVKAPGRKLPLYVYRITAPFAPRSHSQGPRWSTYSGNVVERCPFPYIMAVK